MGQIAVDESGTRKVNSRRSSSRKSSQARLSVSEGKGTRNRETKRPKGNREGWAQGGGDRRRLGGCGSSFLARRCSWEEASRAGPWAAAGGQTGKDRDRQRQAACRDRPEQEHRHHPRILAWWKVRERLRRGDGLLSDGSPWPTCPSPRKAPDPVPSDFRTAFGRSLARWGGLVARTAVGSAQPASTVAVDQEPHRPQVRASVKRTGGTPWPRISL